MLFHRPCLHDGDARSAGTLHRRQLPANPEDRVRAIIWVIQYLNHVQIVYDLYHNGSLDAERYKLWEGFAITMVASKGLHEWWEEEQGKLGFIPEVRMLFDQKISDVQNPPLHFNQ